MTPIVMSWSGGKDGCMALATLLAATNEYRVVTLLTTLMEGRERVQIQNIRRQLIERQAESLGLPLRLVHVPQGANNIEYETRVAEALDDLKTAGVETVAFGDLFLEDIRAYREQFLRRCGMTALFPLWKRDTTILVHDFIDRGYQAIITAVDAVALDRSFAGRTLDRDFLDALPASVDPSGERGEFHTFAYGGPLFREEIRFRVGEVTTADGHFFCDLIPKSTRAATTPTAGEGTNGPAHRG